MLEKYTFHNDEETNAFFQKNPGIYLVKIIIAGGEQHLVITRDKHAFFADHQKKPVMPVPAGVAVPRGYHGGSPRSPRS